MGDAPPPLPPSPVVRPAGGDEVGLTCAICQGPLQASDQVAPCPACSAPFHPECWSENGGCASYGCERVPESTAVPPSPLSVWGQEDRPCPSCGEQIKMAARRCLHCGRAVGPADATAPTRRRRSAPGMGAATLLFVAAILPVSAPVALLAGGLWLRARRGELSRWPSTVRVVMIAAVVAAVAVTLVTAVGLAVYLGRHTTFRD